MLKRFRAGAYVAAGAVALLISIGGASAANAQDVYGSSAISCTGTRSASVSSTQLGNGYHTYIANYQVINTNASSTQYQTKQTYGSSQQTQYKVTATSISWTSGTCY